jgi:hypothetical protein
MVKHEFWRQQYRKDRYMEFLLSEEVEERTKDIFTNIMLLSNKGQISLHNMDGVGEYWMILFTHVLEEFQFRYGPYPNGFINGFLKSADIIKPTFPEPPKAKSAIESIGGLKPNQLYKFGKAIHLNEMFGKGKIRISPASFYNDASLNNAIRDDELSFSLKSRADKHLFTTQNNQNIPAIGNVEYRLEVQTNYFVHCFSSNYTLREFDDFEADTCIVIREPMTLVKRMMSCFEQYKQFYRGFASGVKYIDPLNAKPDEVNIFFTKHFKYSYQNEYRTIWLPNAPTLDLEPFFIEIGNMSKYAEIVRI